MTSTTHGIPALLSLLLLAALILSPACLGIRSAAPAPGSSTPSQPVTVTVPPASPRATLPTPPPMTTLSFSAPPPTALPTPPPDVDPIVGKWYAPVPDDLTFEFFADGTFTESSPSFPTYRGTWSLSDEGEAGFYDATILDRWGFRRQVHILHATGTLSIKSMGTLHRIG